ncbi:MAG TPA: hypothetical protein VGF86_07835 [Candidatus Tumulicola sp.]
MSRRAFFAIVQARLLEEYGTIVYACAAAAVVGFIQPHGLAGPIFFCSLLGIAIALIQRAGRHAYLDLSEQSAPLFGRELARAKAVVPCVVATLATVAYCVAAEVAGSRNLPLTLLVAFAAVIPSTLTALSATVRTGPSMLLYVAIAAGVSAAAFALVVDGGSPAGELGFSALASFLALRQYGEALARYDPV